MFNIIVPIVVTIQFYKDTNKVIHPVWTPWFIIIILIFPDLKIYIYVQLCSLGESEKTVVGGSRQINTAYPKQQFP